MAFLIGGANSLTGGYDIDNSLRFNDGDTPKLSRSISSAGSTTNATLSVWVKRGILGTRQQIYSNKTADSSFEAMNMYFNAANDRLHIDHNDGSNNKSIYTNMRFRDVAAWYHIVHAIDTTTNTATNRLRVYVNGTEITSFATDQNPSKDADLAITNATGDQSIGDDPRDNNDLFDGYMAEYNFVDGATLDPTNFGETNDNGVWIPKKPDVSSYGTNGFFLEFKQTGTSANSSGLGADTSGNDNHMSVANLAATDVTTDTPTNNFCTLSSIDVNVGQVPTFEEGNTKFTVASGNNHGRTDATIRPSSGKWYAEFTFLSGYSTANGTTQVGIISGNAGRNSSNNDGYDQDNGNDSEAIGYRSNGTVKNHGTESLSGLTTFTTDDIMGIALDLDNDKFFVSKNGTFFSNGTGTQDPPNGTNPLFSGGVITSHKIHGFNIGAKGYGDAQNVIAANFGNPHTSISSGNTDSKYGNFEYAPPSGFYALCTKNLATYG